MDLKRKNYQRNSSWNAPYTFSGKEKDVETGYGYFGARYYDSGLSIWLSVDPMSDKYPSMSPYNYCANNPVILVDPDGREFGDFYNTEGTWVGNDGIDDNRVYQQNEVGDVAFAGGRYSYVGDVSETKMEFTGNMVQNSEKAEGNLNVIQVVNVQNVEIPYSPTKEFTKLSNDAVSGSRTLYALENGNYESSNYRTRTLTSMVRDGVGFSIDLNPLFTTGRSLLRIHPDGDPSGTEGCIGLTGNASQLNRFVNTVSPFYNNGGTMPLKVNITNNPNHNQPVNRQ